MKELKGRVLVADDEETIRRIVTLKLSAEGYCCEVAVDGQDALTKVSTGDFDLLLMDVKMPGISGLQLLPQLLRDHPGIPVVIMTGLVDLEVAEEAAKLGAFDLIAKPFDLNDLSTVIEKAMERRRLIRGEKKAD